MSVPCRGCGVLVVVGRRGRLPRYCGARCRPPKIKPKKIGAFVTAVCDNCGVSFSYTRSRARPRRWCSVSCGNAFNYRKRGYRSVLADVPPRRCVICGSEFMVKSRKARVCSGRCREILAGRRLGPIPPKPCFKCGRPFTPKTRRGKYCSKKCACAYKGWTESAKAHWQIRRARKRGVGYEYVKPVEIFDRDGWCCQICGVSVTRSCGVRDDRYATIDHIIPVSRNGPHNRRNLQTACWSCNSRKRASTVGQQLRLIG